MSAMTISLPASLEAFVGEPVAERGSGTGSEHLRELMRKDQEPLRRRNLLLEGAASAQGSPPTPSATGRRG